MTFDQSQAGFDANARLLEARQLLFRFDYRRALELAAIVRQGSQETGDSRRQCEAAALMMDAFRLMGLHTDALSSAQEALTLAAKQGFHPTAIDALCCSARVYLAINRPDECFQALEQTIDHQSLDPFSGAEANLTLADAYLHIGEPGMATLICDSMGTSINETMQAPDPADRFNPYVPKWFELDLKLRLRQALSAAARREYLEAEDILQGQIEHAETARDATLGWNTPEEAGQIAEVWSHNESVFRLRRAQCLRLVERHQEAEEELVQALAAAQTTGDATMTFLIASERSALALVVDDPRMALEHAEGGLHLLESELASVRDEDFRIALRDSRQRIFEYGVEAALRAGDYTRAWAFSERSRARLLLSRIEARSKPQAKTEPHALSASIDPRTCLLEFFVTGDMVVIFRLFKGELTIKYLMVARETLEIEVRRFRDLIAEQRSSNAHTPCSEFDELSRKLYCDLIEPSLPRLSAVDRICVVPHGILHYLPFACLRGSTWFAEMAPIFRAPSATILGALLDRPERHTIRKVAVLANATPRTEPLEGAESEAKSIKRLFPPATLALGSEATREALRAACTGSDVVHVACHAAFDADAPFLSHIKLAPNEDSGDDGHVNVGMVREVPVSADLVVLSGCETGLNAISAAEEFTGLVHAFIGSGAASVVASLWPVSDAGSCALMETFYAQLRSGIGAVQSLHQARLEVMEERPLPFYWAAFEIHGDWRTFRPVRAS